MQAILQTMLLLVIPIAMGILLYMFGFKGEGISNDKVEPASQASASDCGEKKAS